MSITMAQLASRYARAARTLEADTSSNLGRLAQAGVGLVKVAIQDYHAVDTGTMLNSTTADKSGKDTYLIGPTVNYAKYVANGTSRMPARPFHIKAAQRLRSQAAALGFSPDI